MTDRSAAILERFRTQYGKDIDLTLRPAYRDLLAKLGDPHKKLPPVFHVAGTNGKGSTCAFLRAMLEAAGYKVHVYTSPHLVTFHERIRIAGHLITEDELAAILKECEALAEPGGVSYFEAATAAAFVAFARHAADFTILEVGLGGRLDATNIIDKPVATLISRLSFDHREYLGDTLAAIAREKAGIMRPGIPCFAAAQADADALKALRDAAAALKTPLLVGGQDWKVELQANGFRFSDMARKYDLPPPALLGEHQYQNAGLAIAALSALDRSVPVPALAEGLRRVEWPARLQRLWPEKPGGSLAALLPPGSELWLDGGHNDSAGEVLARQIDQWRHEDGPRPKRLYVILGMLTSKRPAEFLSPFADRITALYTVPVPDPLGYAPETLAAEVRQLGIDTVMAGEIEGALARWANSATPPRVLICGSLYLAGHVLSLEAAQKQ